MSPFQHVIPYQGLVQTSLFPFRKRCRESRARSEQGLIPHSDSEPPSYQAAFSPVSSTVKREALATDLVDDTLAFEPDVEEGYTGNLIR